MLDRGHFVVDLTPSKDITTKEIQHEQHFSPEKQVLGRELALIDDVTTGNQTEKETEQIPKTAWCSLLKEPPPSAGKEIFTFMEPTLEDGILEIEEEILKEGSKEWEEKLVGFFLDKKLPFMVVKEAILKKWKPKGQVDVALDGDIFYFTFYNSEDKHEALDLGSVYLSGKLFVIKPWSREVEENRGEIHSVPIWVKMHHVPKNLWNIKGFSRLDCGVFGHSKANYIKGIKIPEKASSVYKNAGTTNENRAGRAKDTRNKGKGAQEWTQPKQTWRRKASKENDKDELARGGRNTRNIFEKGSSSKNPIEVSHNRFTSLEVLDEVAEETDEDKDDEGEGKNDEIIPETQEEMQEDVLQNNIQDTTRRIQNVESI
ncbi:hypothetical protein FRX31_014324 [Thalictrum thalictroides]|uniref:DUF4283 domain-containing protein n=1 Tax=Thalictrum thalictroides TaxID=46969 RepID=A0A7J6WGN5_THATH|nr:hypothetical protein FRX31_014324 [Thalictrum thalictroides]